MYDLTIRSNPALERILTDHPRVSSLQHVHAGPDLGWVQGRWARSIQVSPEPELRGLVELMDNNPLVCADELGLPGPGVTLALIALGPLIRSSILIEPPVLTTNAPLEDAELDEFLRPTGWPHGAEVTYEERGLDSVLAMTALAVVQTPANLEELDELFEEAYGRSFFVRHNESPDWHVSLVQDKPYALYQLRITPDTPHSLLRIQVMSDMHGKAGESQIVHAFNVMAGFEESLGLG